MNEMNEMQNTKRTKGRAVSDRERIFEDGSRDQWTALEAHALACFACAEEIRAWKSLSMAATELRDYSDDPSLWPRIHRSLLEEAAKIEQSKSRWTWESMRRSFFVSWQTAAWQAAVVLRSGCVRRRVYLSPQNDEQFRVLPRNRRRQAGDLLRNNALAEVERTQSDYMHAIDKLAAEAKPQLDKSETPLLANYREKLQVLDSAIDDLRAQARTKSVQRAPALSVPRDVSGKTAHARRSSGGKAIMLSSITFRGAGGATRQRRHRLSASVSMPTCAVVSWHRFFRNPCRCCAAPAQQEVTRDFQKTLTLTAGPSLSHREQVRRSASAWRIQPRSEDLRHDSRASPFP